MRVAPFRGSSGVVMCYKCDELDKKIEHLRSVSSQMADQTTIDGINALCDSGKPALINIREAIEAGRD